MASPEMPHLLGRSENRCTIKGLAVEVRPVDGINAGRVLRRWYRAKGPHRHSRPSGAIEAVYRTELMNAVVLQLASLAEHGRKWGLCVHERWSIPAAAAAGIRS